MLSTASALYIQNIQYTRFLTLLLNLCITNKPKRFQTILFNKRRNFLRNKITLPDRNPIVIQVVSLVVAPVPIAALLIPIPVQALLLVLLVGALHLLVSGRSPQFLDPCGTTHIFYALYSHGDGGG